MVEVSVNKIDFYPVPYTFSCRDGENLIYFRTPETETTSASKLYEIVVDVTGKMDRDGPPESSVNVTVSELMLNITSTSLEEVSVSINGSPYYTVPTQREGVVGDNELNFVYSATELYNQSKPTVKVVNIEKLVNPNTPSVNDLILIYHNPSFGKVTVTGGGYGISTDGGQTYNPTPIILDMVVGDNPIKIKLIATDMYNESPAVDVVVTVPKATNAQIINESDITLSHTDFTVHATGSDTLEGSMVDGVWSTLPVDFIGVVGINSIKFRIRETDNYSPSQPITKTYTLSKLQKSPPIETDITMTRDGLSITVSSPLYGLECRVGGNMYDLPHTFGGAIGVNVVDIRYKETPTHESSQFVQKSLTLEKLQNPKTPSISYVANWKNITINADDEHEVGTDCINWNTPPFPFIGVIGSNRIYGRLKETSRYLPSNTVEDVVIIEKIVNPVIPTVNITVDENTKNIRVSGDISIEARLVGGEYKTIPLVLGGIVGFNTVEYRFKETDLYLPSGTLTSNVEVPKMNRHAPTDDDFDATTHGLSLIITSQHNDIEATIFDGVWREVRYVFTGDPGDYVIGIRYKETDEYHVSPSRDIVRTIERQPTPFTPSNHSYTRDGMFVTVTSEGGTEVSLDGENWHDVPYTFTGAIGQNLVKVRFAETSTELHGPSVDYLITLGKLPNPITPVVTEQFNGLSVILTADACEFDVNSDSVYEPSPVTFYVETAGLKSVMVRANETDVYLVGGAVSYEFTVPKIPNPNSPSLTHSSNLRQITLDGDSSVEIVTSVGASISILPYVTIGEYGTNTFYFRTKETDVYLAGDIKMVDVELVKNIKNDPPILGDVVFSNDGLNVTLISHRTDVEVSVDGLAFDRPPFSYIGVIGDNSVYYRVVETDDRLSSDIVSSVFVIEDGSIEIDPTWQITVPYPFSPATPTVHFRRAYLVRPEYILVAISDYQSSKVVKSISKYSMSGELLFNYKSEVGSYINNMTVDNNDNIYVTSGSTITKISSNGDEIYTNSISASAVYVDNDDNVFVSRPHAYNVERHTGDIGTKLMSYSMSNNSDMHGEVIGISDSCVFTPKSIAGNPYVYQYDKDSGSVIKSVIACSHAIDRITVSDDQTQVVVISGTGKRISSINVDGLSHNYKDVILPVSHVHRGIPIIFTDKGLLIPAIALKDSKNIPVTVWMKPDMSVKVFENVSGQASKTDNRTLYGLNIIDGVINIVKYNINI